MEHKSSTILTDAAPAVELQNLSINFRCYHQRPSTLKEHIIGFIKTGSLKYYTKFEALSNITLTVNRGEIFGILGSNGAGKSTLLKAIAGVLKPTNGSINIHGSLDSLVQLGAGFDAELNAVENIYLAGSLRKWSKSYIDKRVNEIIEFAELENFETMPIKYYSSGMYARLGFAVAIDANPEILLVDEVIAVGDERFQQKCRKVITELYTSGRTVIMVSHNINFLASISNRVGVLQKGQFIYVGEPSGAIDCYRSDAYQTRL